MFNDPGSDPKFDTCVRLGAAEAGSAAETTTAAARSTVLPARAANRRMIPRPLLDSVLRIGELLETDVGRFTVLPVTLLR
jgi:hypothetical protein